MIKTTAMLLDELQDYRYPANKLAYGGAGEIELNNAATFPRSRQALFDGLLQIQACVCWSVAKSVQFS